MSTTTEARIGVRHACMYAYEPGRHTAGHGGARRTRCGYCGGAVLNERGTYGVYPWTRTGRYPLGDAVVTFATETAAWKRAEQLGTDYVVRWVTL